jgi:soluble lytic murein transglycosylase-like protein
MHRRAERGDRMSVTEVMGRIAQLQSQFAVGRVVPTAQSTAVSSAQFATTLQSAVATTRTASTTAATAGGSVTGVPYADLFNAAGAKYGVSPKLLAAVAKVESGYNPKAVSPAGARGLMQIMPGTAKGLGVSDAFDPAQAVEGAAKLLSSNLKEFGSVDLALAAYNAGGGAVKKHGGIPPYAETQAYVPKVKAALAALGG